MQSYPEIPVENQKLAACLHRPALSENVDVPIVICCHGLTGTRVGTAYRLVELARRLERESIACLRFDFRGCGESDGRFEDLTTQTLFDDLRAVFEWVSRTRGIDATRVGILGSSFGAYTAARGARFMDGLRCLVFLAPVANPHALTRQDMTEAGWTFLRKNGWIEHNGQRLGAQFFDTYPGDDVPVLLAQSAAPLLIFHGQGDKSVPIVHGRDYESAMQKAGRVVELRTLDTHDHGMRNIAATDTILAGAVEWFRRHL